MAWADAVIDLNRLSELDFIVQENGTLRVGALTRHRTLEVSDTVRTAQPLMARAAGEVGASGDSQPGARLAAAWSTPTRLRNGRWWR